MSAISTNEGYLLSLAAFASPHPLRELGTHLHLGGLESTWKTQESFQPNRIQTWVICVTDECSNHYTNPALICDASWQKGHKVGEVDLEILVRLKSVQNTLQIGTQNIYLS